MSTYRLVESENDLEEAYEDLLNEKEGIGFDTETYGTDLTDRMFAAQFATANAVWYFNFHAYGGEDGPIVWERERICKRLENVFQGLDRIWFIHNAKFDLRRLALEGIKVSGGVHCTQMQERFVYNQYQKYSLDACLARRGMAKDDAVSKYVAEQKLWTGTGKHKRKHYEKVPFDIMFRYGCMDAEQVRLLGIDQRNVLQQHAFYHNDLELEKVAFEMEQIGIKVRTDYATGGLQYEQAQQKSTSDELSRLAGEPFRSGPIWLRGIFDKHAVPYRTNPKTGNPVFDKNALDEIDHPIAGLIRKYRRHEKYGGTYYEHYAKNELVHAEIKLFGTDTGRFSYAEPNLQNVPKEETLDDSIPFQVRGCFTPRSKDHVFAMVDFNQQEFRLLLDYAGEQALINRINDHGEDVHQATADMVGCSRKHAKTINFGLLYGMGAEKLAKALGISIAEAKTLKALYFSRLPKVQKLIEAIIKKAEREKYVQTWVGRKLWVPQPWRDPDTGGLVRFEYVMPNHLIQGGCGDIARMAMVPIHDLLRSQCSRSAMLLQVHDELLFEIHKDELGVLPDIVKIMENTYRPFNGMKLTCGVEHSWVSWGKRDVVEGLPSEQNKERIEA